MFDRSDTLTVWKSGLPQHNTNVHANALQGLQYLQQHYPQNSYFIINHPSRKLEFTIADLRDFHNCAPGVVLGFEGLPGHQINPNKRCKYDFELGDRVNYHSKTYGGADFMLAKVGGVWDALLGEGRKFWVFTDSDFHRPGEDSWPGEFSKNYIWVNDSSYQSLIEGMKSGKLFVASGNLISDLQLTAEAEGKKVEMGETLHAQDESIITMKISFRIPEMDDRGNAVHVDHIDLICGDISGIISPDAKEYNNPNNCSTKILKRFSESDWKIDKSGMCSILYSFSATHPQYFRLRGTNVPIGTMNETDHHGNPLCDTLTGANNEKEAWNDLWFYSNPIFIEITR
jgi:hypothetical protein